MMSWGGGCVLSSMFESAAVLRSLLLLTPMFPKRQPEIAKGRLAFVPSALEEEVEEKATSTLNFLFLFSQSNNIC